MYSIKRYIKELDANIKTRSSTEHSHRPALKNLLEDIFKDIVALNEPKRQKKIGAPDFIITKNNVPIGYIETKDVHVDLNLSEKTEQIQRYIHGLENLIITNYLEFRWYFQGELRETITLGAVINSGIKMIKNDENLVEMFKNFINQNTNIITSSKELAVRMASISKLCYYNILNLLKQDINKNSDMYKQYLSLKEALINDLELTQFADMLAQTMSYGLFTARIHQDNAEEFNRMTAAYIIPRTNPFLRDFFSNIVGPSMNKNLEWVVDNLVNLLKNTDIGRIVKGFEQNIGKEDPIVHFYETFLEAYKPEERILRGVYYTPKPVVNYIVRSIDVLLKKEFGMKKGLADEKKVSLNVENKIHSIPKVQILDPTVGTGTFLSSVIDEIFLNYTHNKGMWPGFVREHLLKSINGFELLMSPYTIAHMKLGMKLKQTGYEFEDGDRLRIYLTNSLEKPDKNTGFPLLTYMSNFITGEAEEANKIKKDYPIMVIIGNPPYKSVSANNIPWINSLMRGYDEINNRYSDNYFNLNNTPLGERNTKWLNDDYVKFFRFAQWKIQQNGSGIVAFVTPHGYLENPTFKGMRNSLMNTFDDIYVIDLHGNANKGEGRRNKDANVFDIKQGVSISILVKSEKKKSSSNVYHYDLWGDRNTKFNWLNSHTVENTNWEKTSPENPLFLFVPEDEKYRSEYDEGISINEIFPLYSNGIVTARDKFTITKRKDDLINRINEFVTLDTEDAREKFNLGPDSRDWKIHYAQNDLIESKLSEDNIQKICYRPFDIRYTYYTGRTKGFICMPRREVMENMLEENLAILTSRMTKGEEFKHILVTNLISEAIALSSKTSNNAFAFPLYKYINGRKSVNIKSEFISKIEDKTQLKYKNINDTANSFNEKDIFYYIVALLSSKLYQNKYKEYLKRDFPKVFIPKSNKIFNGLSKFGEKLTKAYLMDVKIDSQINFPITGSNIVNSIKYKQNKRQLWINEKQYFEDISSELWNYEIGGYKVINKWLKYREKVKLEYSDYLHFQIMCNSLYNLIAIQKHIDDFINNNGGFPLN